MTVLQRGWTAALRWPVKKIAAMAAMLGATAYCIFSGGDVATERSLIMTLVMLGAILVDRAALSMRNLALAAMIVLPAWGVIGLLVYFVYARSRSHVGRGLMEVHEPEYADLEPDIPGVANRDHD